MKGILFKQEMIKAIIEGRKTVTRRLLNPQPSDEESLECSYFTPALEDKNGEQYPADYEVFGAYTSDGEYSWKPRYLPGEVVYVKEAWCESYFQEPIIYKMDGGESPGPKGFWRSPMFLPEKFARYFLRIKDVRPERLQEITEADAVREGVQYTALWHKDIDGEERALLYDRKMPVSTYRTAFANLWDSINKNNQWKSNPWVWRIEFELIEKQGLERVK